MRLIDADAIKLYYGGLVHIPYNDFIGIANYFMNQIKEMPTVTPEPHWIPVTERLPGEDDYRPCYGYEDGAVWWLNDMGLMGLGWYYPSTGKWAYYNESSGCEDRVGNVVAWTHLPKLYRGEERDD